MATATEIPGEDFGLDTPGWDEVLSQWMRANMKQLATWFPVKVRDFDLGKKTVTAECQLDLGEDTPSPLPNVPVLWPDGTYWDIDNGETGIVLVGWRNIRNWLLTGVKSVPQDDGIHDRANCCFVPGLWPFQTAQEMSLDPGTKVIPLGLLTQLRLAEHDADEPIIRGEAFLDQFKNVLVEWVTWIAAVSAATGVPGTNLLNEIGILSAGIPGYLSDEVFIPGAGP